MTYSGTSQFTKITSLVSVIFYMLNFSDHTYSDCLRDSPIYMNWPGWSDRADPLTQRWGPAVSYHSGLKWIWFNQGGTKNPTSKLEILTVYHPVFADELYYLEKGPIHS